MTTHRRSVRRPRGFTLVELLVAVAIVGIVAAIAAPGYARHVREARRADAIAFLLEVAGEQARHFSEHAAYAPTMAALGYGDGESRLSPGGHYRVAIDAVGPRRYVLSATAVPDGPQASDAGCTTLVLASTGARTPSAAADGADCW